MSTQGPNNPASATSDGSNGGDVAWSNPTNVFSSNDSRATSSLGAFQFTENLSVTNFGFSIPSGATINGVQVEVERSASAINRITDQLVMLQWNNGANLSADDKFDSVTKWPTTDTYKSYGGAADTWGSALTDTIINSSSFGILLAAISGSSAQCRVDHVRITVTYTVGGGGPMAGIYYYTLIAGSSGHSA